MAVETTITRPAPFVETLGEDLAKQVVAQTGVPLVTTGVGGLTQQAGETTMGRLRMLEDKAQSREVLSADEIAEIKRLSEIFNKANGGRIGLKDGT